MKTFFNRSLIAHFVPNNVRHYAVILPTLSSVHFSSQTVYTIHYTNRKKNPTHMIIDLFRYNFIYNVCFEVLSALAEKVKQLLYY